MSPKDVAFGLKLEFCSIEVKIKFLGDQEFCMTKNKYPLLFCPNTSVNISLPFRNETVGLKWLRTTFVSDFVLSPSNEIV